MKYSVNKSISFNQSASSLFKSKSTLSISNAKSNTKSHHKDSSYSSILLPYNMNNKIQGSLNSERHSKKHYKNESVSSISALQRSSSTTFTTIKKVSSMKIAFGKIVPKEKNRLMLLRSVTKRSTRTEIDEPITKRVGSTSRMRPETAREVINIFKTGLGKKEKEKIIGTEEEIEKSKKKKNEYNKGFPLIAPKKIVKNILPKEYDFNKVKTPEEVLRNAYHPVVRYQKNVLNKHINAINQEINVNYSNTFCLIKKDKFSEKFRMCQDLIDLEKDTKLIEMIGELINKNFKLGNEINEVLEEKKRKEEYERKQKILLRFKQVLIRAAIHFKRLNINLDDFLTKNSKTIQPFEEASSYNLICAIKDKDPEAVLRMIKQNKFVVFDFDHVRYIYLIYIVQTNSFTLGCKKKFISSYIFISK